MGAVKILKIQKGPILLRQDLRDLERMLERKNLSNGARKSIEIEIEETKKQLRQYERERNRTDTPD